MKALLIPFLLQLAGIVVIIAEVILPSGGILTLIATGLIGYSLYIVFTTVSSSAGMVFVLADIVIVPVTIIIGLKLLVKSPATLRTQLSQKNGVSSQDPEMISYVGQEGKATTDLRPAGTASVNGRRLDVVTRGEYIDKESEIVVLKVTGNQIIVSKK